MCHTPAQWDRSGSHRKASEKAFGSHLAFAFLSLGFPGGSKSTNLPAMWETWVWSLGWEDPLEKEMTTHSSILTYRIPWTKDPGWLQPMGLQRVRHNWTTFMFPSLPVTLLAAWNTDERPNVGPLFGGSKRVEKWNEPGHSEQTTYFRSPWY